jgi:prepilin-type N-terminal cleavage/methylation domain-containing protein
MVDDKCYAFTLVELLIVLSIVAILAMVAAPKMLESKLLSTLTQVSQDQRLIQSALDAYFQDWGGYPRDHDSRWPLPNAGEQDGFTQLTSPIRYLTFQPQDPFGTTDVFKGLSYEGGSGSDQIPECGRASFVRLLYRDISARKWGSSSCIHAYLIISLGPDKTDNTNGNDGFPYSTVLKSYSPTNGTKSYGDIYHMTGQYRRGNVTLDGIPITSLSNQSKKGGQQ